MMQFASRLIVTAVAAAVVSAPALAAELTGTLKKVKDKGEIVIGYRESSIPFSYLDGNQKPAGYMMDLCNRVVADVKKELNMPTLVTRLVPVTSQTRIPLMTNGTVDLECGSTTNSVERQKQVAFSVSTYVTSVRMLVKSRSGIKSIDDVDGKSVVTTTGTTSDRYIKQNEKGKQLNIKNVYGKDHADSFLMVETGRAAAFVMDDILLAGLVANSSNAAGYSISEDALSVEPYGIMLRKDDPAFKKVVDDAMTKIYKSGQLTAIYDKWFTKAIPPRGINLSIPMSAAMKKVVATPTDTAEPAFYSSK